APRERPDEIPELVNALGYGALVASGNALQNRLFHTQLYGYVRLVPGFGFSRLCSGPQSKSPAVLVSISRVEWAAQDQVTRRISRFGKPHRKIAGPQQCIGRQIH